MYKGRPAVHHNPNKEAAVRFWYKNQYKKVTMKVDNRAEAIRRIKAEYPSAIRISVVFFVKVATNE